MELTYLSKDAIQKFKVNFDVYKKHYHDEGNEWFLRHWEQNGALKTSSLSAPDILFSYTEDFTKSDKANVIAVHSALKRIPLSAAADERFWAAFCHTDGWRFVQHRRAADIETNDSQRLLTLFFFSAGTRRSCYLNAAAKYWWCGHMIYDAEARDPYEALDVICGLPYFSSLVFFMASSNFTSNKNVLLGIIDSFRKLRSQDIEIKLNDWKELLIYLNKLGAVMILDALSRTDITGICDRQLQKLLQKKSAAGISGLTAKSKSKLNKLN